MSDARRTIFERRSRFVAEALAMAGLVTACEGGDGPVSATTSAPDPVEQRQPIDPKEREEILEELSASPCLSVARPRGGAMRGGVTKAPRKGIEEAGKDGLAADAGGCREGDPLCGP